MALVMFLRNVPKTQACPVFGQILLKRTPLVAVATTNLQAFSQLSLQNKCQPALNLKSKVGSASILNPYLTCRTISLSEPRKAAAGHDHSKHWTLEKMLSIALLGVVPATFAYPNIVLDNVFAVLTIIHLHWGFDACIEDYVRPIVVGHAFNKLAWIALYIVSATTLGGLLYLNINDIGIGRTFCRLWSIKN